MNDHAPSDARSLDADLARLQASVQEVAGQLDRALCETVKAAPLVAVGTAAAFGFLVGGGVTRNALGMFLGIGARMAGSWLQAEFLDRTEPQE
jgi:hypothetical protein